MWTEFNKENMPKPHTLVWVKRKFGDYENIYLAMRNNKPFSENKDPSRDSFWEGNPLENAATMILEDYNSNFRHSFSDVTVTHFALLEPPPNTYQ